MDYCVRIHVEDNEGRNVNQSASGALLTLVDDNSANCITFISTRDPYQPVFLLGATLSGAVSLLHSLKESPAYPEIANLFKTETAQHFLMCLVDDKKYEPLFMKHLDTEKIQPRDTEAEKADRYRTLLNIMKAGADLLTPKDQEEPKSSADEEPSGS